MKQLFLILTIIVFLFTGCEKDSSSVNGTSSSNVTLKFEVVSTSAFSTVFLNGAQFLPPLNVTYTNESGQQQIEQINTNTSTWSKTIQLTETRRPINILFNATAYTATATGTGVVRVYVNGIQKAFQNVQMTSNPYQAGGLTTGAIGTFSGFLFFPLY